MVRSPEQIIRDQVRIWEHRRDMERQGAARPRFWPCITISREFGAQGAALADALAGRTGFGLWDLALVEAIARESGGDERILRTLDERRRKAIDDVVHAALEHGRHTNLKYLRSLMRVVHTLAAHGSSIIVGRGANFICKPGSVLRVRVVCPLDIRVRRMAEREKIDEREARRLIVQRDAERADFVRYHFRQDVADPVCYDLVLNAGTYALDHLTDLTLAAYEAFAGARPPVPTHSGVLDAKAV